MSEPADNGSVRGDDGPKPGEYNISSDTISSGTISLGTVSLGTVSRAPHANISASGLVYERKRFEPADFVDDHVIPILSGTHRKSAFD